MSPTTKADRYVDAKGQMCPMPILTLAKAMREIQPGQVICLSATDAGAMPDVRAWCEKTGNTLLDSADASGVLTFYIRKTA
jgi:tRNA 2-thiouridine synthesizing protein A